ncbi:hypothetical protein EJ05DRAFT_477970 [Pseudovirgaria hyperparasitica]|uniref:Uncharacterized protein n=1 Tax=Pseudovirgaria hyperparasitica TaxID=470096 RepID=A0A6A6VZ05_9PEZI|nr:uncharacterized protein EJ05DRAFT_477970 [Pseudovirgaria hyperparasitica]KAF2755908.1 hypothetical protein EJ05DRAFT_477970 [Pseudovirgaria hyperparasitica]
MVLIRVVFFTVALLAQLAPSPNDVTLCESSKVPLPDTLYSHRRHYRVSKGLAVYLILSMRCLLVLTLEPRTSNLSNLSNFPKLTMIEIFGLAQDGWTLKPIQMDCSGITSVHRLHEIKYVESKLERG